MKCMGGKYMENQDLKENTNLIEYTDESIDDNLEMEEIGEVE